MPLGRVEFVETKIWRDGRRKSPVLDFDYILETEDGVMFLLHVFHTQVLGPNWIDSDEGLLFVKAWRKRPIYSNRSPLAFGFITFSNQEEEGKKHPGSKRLTEDARIDSEVQKRWEEIVANLYGFSTPEIEKAEG